MKDDKLRKLGEDILMICEIEKLTPEEMEKLFRKLHQTVAMFQMVQSAKEAVQEEHDCMGCGDCVAEDLKKKLGE